MRIPRVLTAIVRGPLRTLSLLTLLMLGTWSPAAAITYTYTGADFVTARDLGYTHLTLEFTADGVVANLVSQPFSSRWTYSDGVHAFSGSGGFERLWTDAQGMPTQWFWGLEEHILPDGHAMTTACMSQGGDVIGVRSFDPALGFETMATTGGALGRWTIPDPVPEPSTFGLLGLGLMAVGLRSWRAAFEKKETPGGALAA